VVKWEMGTGLGGRIGLDQHVGSGSLSVEYIDLVNMGSKIL